MAMHEGTHSDKHAFWKWLEFLCELIGGVLMVVATIVLFSAVLFRYVLHSPLGWTDELSRVVFMWITFLGAAVCCVDEIHTRFDLFFKRLRPLHQAIMHSFGILLILILIAVYIVAGISGAKLISFERFIILDIPYSVGYIALPISAGLMALFYLRNLRIQINRIRAILKGGEDAGISSRPEEIGLHEPLV